MTKKVARRTPVPGSKQTRPANAASSPSTQSGAAASSNPTTSRETPRREAPRAGGARVFTPSRRTRNLPWGAIAASVGGILFLGLLAWLAMGGPAATADLGERRVADEGRSHVEVGQPTNWTVNPPASGSHYPSTTTWAVHSEEVHPGFWIHNLEHGGIVLLYKCPENSCPETISQIESLSQRLPQSRHGNVKFAAVPYNDMEPNFMVSAWSVQLDLDTLDTQKITDFYRKYVDKGPEDVP